MASQFYIVHNVCTYNTFNNMYAMVVPSFRSTTAPTVFSSNVDDNELENERQMVQNMSECNVENYIEGNDNGGETIIVLESNASTSRDSITDINESIIKRRKCIETEEELNLLRMKSIIQQEQQLALVKLHHEERMAVIKEEHLKKINQLEIRATLAKVELAELLLKKEKGRMSNYNS